MQPLERHVFVSIQIPEEMPARVVEGEAAKFTGDWGWRCPKSERDGGTAVGTKVLVSLVGVSRCAVPRLEISTPARDAPDEPDACEEELVMFHVG